MKRNAVRKSTTGNHRRIWTIAIVTASAVALPITSIAPAGADNASTLYDHKVCADSLTEYNSGYIQTLDWGDRFYITGYGGSNHVWGYGYHNDGPGLYGWVYNGWFCSS